MKKYRMILKTITGDEECVTIATADVRARLQRFLIDGTVKDIEGNVVWFHKSNIIKVWYEEITELVDHAAELLSKGF